MTKFQENDHVLFTDSFTGEVTRCRVAQVAPAESVWDYILTPVEEVYFEARQRECNADNSAAAIRRSLDAGEEVTADGAAVNALLTTANLAHMEHDAEDEVYAVPEGVDYNLCPAPYGSVYIDAVKDGGLKGVCAFFQDAA